jgi:hypothetical protein
VKVPENGTLVLARSWPGTSHKAFAGAAPPEVAVRDTKEIRSPAPVPWWPVTSAR